MRIVVILTNINGRTGLSTSPTSGVKIRTRARVPTSTNSRALVRVKVCEKENEYE